MTCVMSCINKNSSYWDTLSDQGKRNLVRELAESSSYPSFSYRDPSVRFQLKSACPRYNFE